MANIISVAKEWCKKHPGWQTICELPQPTAAECSYSELSAKEQDFWEANGGESAWRKTGIKYYRCRSGFVGKSGKYYRSLVELIKVERDFVMVFRTKDFEQNLRFRA